MKNGVLIASILLFSVFGEGCGTAKEMTNVKKRTPKESAKTELYDESEDLSGELITNDKTISGAGSSRTDLPIRSYSDEGDYYVGLAAVRSQDRITYYDKNAEPESISDSEEMIYPIFEVFNVSDETIECNTFFDCWDIELYVDSQKVSEVDISLMLGIDSFSQHQFYFVDPQRSVIFLEGFLVDKGWSEMVVFFGDASWSITPDDIMYDKYDKGSLFEIEKPSETEIGTTLYSKNFDLIYDGFEIYSNSRKNEKYAVFKFTINNQSTKDVTCDNWGWRSRCYVDYICLDLYSSRLRDHIDGYTNISEVERVRAGMSAKVYLAYRLPVDEGIIECYFDIGYCYENNLIGYVCVEQ